MKGNANIDLATEVLAHSFGYLVGKQPCPMSHIYAHACGIMIVTFLHTTRMVRKGKAKPIGEEFVVPDSLPWIKDAVEAAPTLLEALDSGKLDMAEPMDVWCIVEVFIKLNFQVPRDMDAGPIADGCIAHYMEHKIRGGV